MALGTFGFGFQGGGGGIPVAETWAQTLAAGASSGGTSPIISSGDTLDFSDSGFTGSLDTLTLGAARTWNLPDKSGTIALLSDITGGGFSDVQTNGGAIVNAAPRTKLNFIEAAGLSVNISATDNAGNDSVDITFSGGSNLAQVLERNNSMSSYGITVNTPLGNPEYIGTGGRSPSATTAQIKFTNGADELFIPPSTTYSSSIIDITAGTTGSKVVPNSSIRVVADATWMEHRGFDSYFYLDSTGAYMFSGIELNFQAGGVANLNKIKIVDGGISGNKYTMDFGAIGGNYTATWQQRSGTVAYVDQIGGQNVNSNITSPTAGQDGYVISWNDTNGEYELIAAGGGGGGDGIYGGSGSLIGNTVVTMATNDLQFNTTGITGILTIDATNDRVGIGTSTPNTALQVATNAEQIGARITNSNATAGQKEGLRVEVTGAGGSTVTYGIRLQYATTTGSTSYGIHSVNSPTATTNRAIYAALTGGGSNNRSIVGAATGGSSSNYGVVGVAGSTAEAGDGTDTGVVGQIRGSRANGRAMRSYNASLTTGVSYGLYMDAFGNNSSHKYGIYLAYTTFGQRQTGIRVGVAGATIENTAINVELGDVFFSGGNFVFNNATLDYDFTLKSDANGAMFVMDGSADAIGIGTATPSTSSLMEFSSTTRGVLLPRMSATQAGAITPVNGLVLYVTTTDLTFTSVGFWGFENGAWTKL